MGLKDYRFDGSRTLALRHAPTGAKGVKTGKEKIVARTEKNLEKIGALQDRLYAAGHEGLVVILQAMDAAGKDSTIKHVMTGVNPQGIDVTSFKQPCSEELAHDYLWRAAKAMPARGKIALFNRSYYEDVLVVRVHDMYKNYKMPARCTHDGKKDFFDKRYRQIRNFEEYYYENGYRIIKILLHVSREEQKKRFLERIDTKAKNWKFSDADVKERAYWDDYMDAYETAINETATHHSPWYVVPADAKWYTRYLVSEILLDALTEIDPHYPTLAKEKLDELQSCKDQLTTETENHKG